MKSLRAALALLSLACVAAASGALSFSACSSSSDDNTTDTGDSGDSPDATDPCDLFTNVGESCAPISPRVCFVECEAGGCTCDRDPSSGQGVWHCVTDLSCVPESGPFDFDANPPPPDDDAGDAGDAHDAHG